MVRVKFEKGKSKENDKMPQREFLIKVLNNLACPSLKELINRGINVNYSTLKNYFIEARLLPEDLFNELCRISKIEKEEFKIEYLEDNWGKVKGGEKGKRR